MWGMCNGTCIYRENNKMIIRLILKIGLLEFYLGIEYVPYVNDLCGIYVVVVKRCLDFAGGM